MIMQRPQASVINPEVSDLVWLSLSGYLLQPLALLIPSLLFPLRSVPWRQNAKRKLGQWASELKALCVQEAMLPGSFMEPLHAVPVAKHFLWGETDHGHI